MAINKNLARDKQAFLFSIFFLFQHDFKATSKLYALVNVGE